MRSKLVWTNAAWEDYVYWQSQDKKRSGALTYS